MVDDWASEMMLALEIHFKSHKRALNQGFSRTWGNIQIETVSLHEVGFEITMRHDCRPEDNTCKGMHLMSDSMLAPFAVFQYIISSIVI